jgi:hypothetical protein
VQFLIIYVSLHAVLSKMVTEAPDNFCQHKRGLDHESIARSDPPFGRSVSCGNALADHCSGPALLKDFDRNACYSKCPCEIGGMEQACADCKQKCDEEFWKDFDEKLKNKKGN